MADSDEDSRSEGPSQPNNRQLVFRGSSANNAMILSPEREIAPALSDAPEPNRARKKRKKSSWVWNHFEIRAGKPICLECESSENGRSSNFADSTSTSSLATHLKTKHNIEKDSGSTDVTQTTFSRQAGLLRHDIISGEALSKCSTALVRLIVDAKLSFNLVENNAFQSYVRTLNKHVPTISRRTLVRAIVEEHGKRVPVIKKTLEDIDSNLAITCDGWSSKVYRGYFAVTAHWITKDFDLKSMVIDFVYFPPPHNQWTTRQVLSTILHDWGVERKVTAVTTDNGPEMPQAIEALRNELNSKYDRQLPKYWHIRCACHVVHRGVKDALEPLHATLQKLRSLLNAIRLSTMNRSLFKEAQEHLQLGIVKDAPAVDIENRWSSTYLMIEKSYALKTVFESICNDERANDAIRGNNLTDAAWNELHEIASFLKLPAEITEMTSSSSNSTISIQYRIYNMLQKHCTDFLAKASLPKVVRTAAALMKRKIAKYKPSLTSPHVEVCAALDPRISKKTEDFTHLKQQIRKYLRDTYNVDLTSASQERTEAKPKFSIFDSDSDSETESNNDEIDIFFAATVRADKSCVNVIDWWKREGRHKYPKLALLARDTLMAMGSSVPSESLFSDSGGMARGDRSLLTDEHLRIIVTLRSWNRFLGYTSK